MRFAPISKEKAAWIRSIAKIDVIIYGKTLWMMSDVIPSMFGSMFLRLGRPTYPYIFSLYSIFFRIAFMIHDTYMEATVERNKLCRYWVMWLRIDGVFEF